MEYFVETFHKNIYFQSSLFSGKELKFSFVIAVWNYSCLAARPDFYRVSHSFPSAAPCGLSHTPSDFLQDWAGEPCHDIWPVSVSQQPFVFVWSGASVHDEEQLSCPASGCAHSSAAGSALLRHQMAVSVSLCPPAPLCGAFHLMFSRGGFLLLDVL